MCSVRWLFRVKAVTFFNLNWVISWDIYINTVCYSLFYVHSQYFLTGLGGANDWYLKPIVYMQKQILRYVCCVPAVTPTNPLFLKTGHLKLNEVYDLQFFNWCSVLFQVFVCSVYLHGKRFSEKLNFVIKM